MASRTFTNKIVILTLTIIAMIWVLRIRLPPEEKRSEMVEIRFQWPPGITASEMEEQVISKVENWIIAIDGIEEIDSETNSSYGKIFILPCTVCDVNQLLADIQRSIRVNRYQLPHHIEWPEFSFKKINSYDMTVLIGEPFLSDTHHLNKLIALLSAQEGVIEIEHSGVVKTSRMWNVRERLQPFHDSLTSVTYLPHSGMSESFGFEKKNKSFLKLNGKRYEPRIPFQPEFMDSPVRMNGIPFVELTLRYDHTDTSRIMSVINEYIDREHLKTTVLPVNVSGEFNGFDLPFIYMSIILLGLLTVQSPKSHRIQFIITGCLIIISGYALLLNPANNDFTFEVSFCTPAALLLLTLRSETSSPLVLFTFVIFILTGIFFLPFKNFCIASLILLIPIIYNGILTRPKLPVISLKVKNGIFILIPMIVSVLPGRKFEWQVLTNTPWSMITKKDKTASDFLLKESNSEETEASLFMMQAAEVWEIRSYVRGLEKDLQSLDDPKMSILVHWAPDGYISLRITGKTNHSRVRKLLARKALQASGVRWYITGDNFNFTNQPAPVMPSYTWTVSGYHLDTVNLVVRRLSDSLRRTPGISQLRILKNSWLPELPNRRFSERTINENINKIGLGQIFRNDDHRYSLTTFPSNQWILMNSTFHAGDIALRGYQFIESDTNKLNQVIKKRNRAYVMTIGYEFYGSTRMAEKLYEDQKIKFSQLLPAGISLNSFKNRTQHPQRDVAFFVFCLAFVFLSGILKSNKISHGIFSALRFCMIFLAYQIFLIFSPEIQEYWYGILPVLAVGALFTLEIKVILWMSIAALFIIPWLFTDIPMQMTPGILALLFGNLPIRRVSKLTSEEPSLLLISHDRQFFRTN